MEHPLVSTRYSFSGESKARENTEPQPAKPKKGSRRKVVIDKPDGVPDRLKVVT